MEYLYMHPIYDENSAKYAVAINQSIFNAKLSHFIWSENALLKDKMLIVHSYSKDKQRLWMYLE